MPRHARPRSRACTHALMTCSPLSPVSTCTPRRSSQGRDQPPHPARTAHPHPRTIFSRPISVRAVLKMVAWSRYSAGGHLFLRRPSPDDLHQLESEQGMQVGVRVKREKPCKASGNCGSAGACTRRESGLTSRSQSNR